MHVFQHRRVHDHPGCLRRLVQTRLSVFWPYQKKLPDTSTRIPNPKMKRHFRSRLVSPSKCLKLRYDTDLTLYRKIVVRENTERLERVDTSGFANRGVNPHPNPKGALSPERVDGEMNRRAKGEPAPKTAKPRAG